MQFSVLFYVNTLFTYMFGVKKKELSFVKALGDEMRSTFPDFQENPYYQKRFNEEEKKLVRMQQKSSLFFMIYFSLLWNLQKLQKKIKAIKNKEITKHIKTCNTGNRRRRSR